MKTLSFLLVSALTLVLQPMGANAQTVVKKIAFPAGKNAVVLSGTVTGGQTIDYKLPVKSGDNVKISLSASNGALYFNLLPPGSNDVADFIGSNEGNTYQGTMSQTGTYTIRVYLMRSAARRNEKAPYKLNVMAGQVQRQGDAKVAGTNFNATGMIRASVPGKANTSLKFGVVRYDGGDADVHITLPNGRKRILNFSKGEWSCKGVACKINYKPVNGDEWEVVVNANETYTIPSAVITGG